MASTKASGLKVAVKYVTNEPAPRTFAVAMKACYFTVDAALFGAVAADPEDPQVQSDGRHGAQSVRPDLQRDRHPVGNHRHQRHAGQARGRYGVRQPEGASG
jgi:hypothetical protein